MVNLVSLSNLGGNSRDLIVVVEDEEEEEGRASSRQGKGFPGCSSHLKGTETEAEAEVCKGDVNKFVECCCCCVDFREGSVYKGSFGISLPCSVSVPSSSDPIFLSLFLAVL